MLESDSLVFVLGIDPGLARPASLAAWSVLSLDIATGTVGVLHRAVHLQKASLAERLPVEPLLSDPRLLLAALAAPMTPLPLATKPWKARLVEIRLSRGAFSSSARGPWMPWISSPRTWTRYQRAAQLQEVLQARGFSLLTMPSEDAAFALPSRGIAEVYPKATLALLSPTSTSLARPYATNKFHGQLDDWHFSRLFAEVPGPSLPSIHDTFQDRGLPLRLAEETLEEARRIAGLRRPFPRREPMRAFLAALQGVLALQGAACLVGAPGEYEGSILLPASWHPDWEEEWNHPQRIKIIPQLRRIPVENARANVSLFRSPVSFTSDPFGPTPESRSPRSLL